MFNSGSRWEEGLMKRKVFVAGATGFTGQALLHRLLAHPEIGGVVASVRPGGSERLRRFGSAAPRLALCPAPLAGEEALAAGMEGCEVVVQLIGANAALLRAGGSYESIDLGTTVQLLAAARRARVPRFFFLSSLFVSPRAHGVGVVPAEFFRVKHLAEEAVRASGHEWTVWRPSFITGPGRDRPRETAAVLALRPAVGVLAVLGQKDLAMRLRPIRADELASSMVSVIFAPRPASILEGRSLWETVHAA
jgi:NADH dehydrogenase